MLILKKIPSRALTSSSEKKSVVDIGRGSCYTLSAGCNADLACTSLKIAHLVIYVGIPPTYILFSLYLSSLQKECEAKMHCLR